jgi:hypothetical protein
VVIALKRLIATVFVLIRLISVRAIRFHADGRGIGSGSAW